MTAAPPYPRTERLDVVDHLHGHAVADPYRWLEDPDDPRTRAWSTAQDQLARGHLDALPGRDRFAASLDALKETGFRWATRSGVTISIEDVVTPPGKADILERYEGDAEKIEKQYSRGVITDDERRQELIEIWTKATAEVARAMEDNFPKTNPVWMMVHSGARGNMMQVRQIAGMRGLVANPKGEIIPRPIKANFREGLSVLEYFISTHGARKGLADTALRTADSGYLTRRLVDVSQDVIIREDDCGTERGLPKRIDDEHVETSAYARASAVEITHPECLEGRNWYTATEDAYNEAFNECAFG